MAIAIQINDSASPFIARLIDKGRSPLEIHRAAAEGALPVVRQQLVAKSGLGAYFKATAI